MALFKRKPKKEDLEEFRDITDDVIESDFVPYACHWNKNTIISKNGEALQVIKITGLMRAGQEGEDNANLRAAVRQATEKCVDSTKYAVWVHTIRRKRNFKSPGHYPRDFSGYLNNFWNDKNGWENKFSNEVYITLVREGKDASLKNFDTFIRGVVPRFLVKKFEQHIDNSVKELNGVTRRMVGAMEHYGARLLHIVNRKGICYSEPAEFLSKLITLRDNDFPVEEEDLSKGLTDYDVTFGNNAMEVRMRSDGRRRFGAILTLREYRELELDTLELVLQIPAELVISQSFEFAPSQYATAKYKQQKEIFDVSRIKDLPEKTGMTDILSSDKGKDTDYGRQQLNIFILADSIKMLDRDVAIAVKALATLGMTPMREDVFMEECYWAQLPANFEFVRRMRPINTARIGGFANLSNYSIGNESRNHWGNAITTLNTAHKTPYFFNFHHEDNGHTTVIGVADSDTTTTLNFLLSESRKTSNRIFLFDRGRSSEIFIRALGGQYYNACAPMEKRDYARIFLNPFALEDNTQNRDFLCRWLVSLVPEGGDEDRRGICAKAVAGVMMMEETQRNLEQCVALIYNESAEFAALFEPWVSGSLAGIFFGQDTLELTGAVYGFEMGDIISIPPAIIPVTSYLLHRVNNELSGKPSIIVMKEAWDLLDNNFLAPAIAQWLDDVRRSNAMVIFTTEKAEEVMQSELTEVLLQKAATRIYLPDSNADDRYENAFGLSEDDVAYLGVMNTEDRHFMIKHAGETIISELSLSGMNDIVSVLCASPILLEIMENTINKRGLTATDWMPAFLENIKDFS